MANIDAELNIIKEPGGRGEDVREAIKRAIEAIYNEREYPPSAVTIRQNGTITGGPWNKIIVDVPDGGVSKADVDSCSGDITTNDYYSLQKLKDIGLITSDTCIGVDGFTVNVPQRTGEYGEINITENGTYDPLLDGYDGYSKVYVNVLSSDVKDKYTVRFFDGSKLLEVKTVPRGTNAVYTGTARLSGSNFTGWNPSPISVNRDMDCYAVYGGGGSSAVIDQFTSTISDTWAQIAEKMSTSGQPYEPGNTKTLPLLNGSHVLTMMLIGYNNDVDENGKYVSTWININRLINTADVTQSATMNHIFGEFSLVNHQTYGNRRDYQAQTYCNGHTIWWGNSLLRALLNGEGKDIAFNATVQTGRNDATYFAEQSANHLLLPELINIGAETNLFDRIKRVNKYSFHMDRNSLGQDMPTRDKFTKDKIWIPSSRELSYPSYTGTSGIYKPDYTIKQYMCSKGAAENGSAIQYGNPNNYGNVLLSLYPNGYEPYTRSRDNIYYGTNNLDSGNVLQYPVTRNVNGTDIVVMDNSISYGKYDNPLGWLPIAFCL